MRREQFTVGELLRTGVSDGAVTVLETNGSNLKTEVECATGSIPSAAAGYAIGCRLIDTTTGKIYTNQGSATSCTFNAIGDITSAELADSIDLGSSGAAGDLDIFPSTASKGKLAISATDSTGNTTTAITNAAQSGARTYTIPDAGGSASFVMTSGSQIMSGITTFSVPILYDVDTGITAFAGGGQASATALTAEYNNVFTCATAFDSVKLMTAALGQTQTVKNSGAATLAVFPFSGDTINALAADLSVNIPVNGEVTFRAISANAWETVETLYVSSPTTQTGGLAIAAAASAGNTITTITNASQAAARTYTIPDAGASTSFVMGAGAQTVAGAKTFSSAVKTSVNVGAANTGVTAVEYGDGYTHTTVLTVSQADAVTVADNAALADGYLLYTLPAGAVIVESAYMSMGVTLAEDTTATADVGIGTTLASAVQATLDADNAACENIITGQTASNCSGTATVKTSIPTAAVPLVIETGGAHTVYFNIADTWANTAGADLTGDIAGTVVLNWKFLA